VKSSAGREQQTLRGPCAFEGVGLHTGASARVVLHPQPPGSGIVFRLDGGLTFPARAEYIVDTQRATVLGAAGRTVSTVEHLLSALRGLDVDNALVDVDGPEIPVFDGSAAEFVDAVMRAGVVPQGAPRRDVTVDAPRAYHDGDAVVVILPADEWRVRFAVDFPAPVGAQYFDGTIDAATYARDIAVARTFGYLHEVEALRSRGLALGGSLDNALVFAPDGPMTPLRRPNEVVAHKVLDLVGDFALLGARPRFEIIAHKSGHRLHAMVTRDLCARAAGGVAS
jgi:UDP-3-O-[3-hydroxymyristoyl] N-acetylglucosamine deacetylase